MMIMTDDEEADEENWRKRLLTAVRIIIEGRLRLENLSKKLKEKTFGCPATKIEGKKIKGKLKGSIFYCSAAIEY